MFSFKGLQRMGGLALLAAIAPSPPIVPAAGSGVAFVDLVDYPTQEANWDRFHSLEDSLAGAFHDACADGGCVPRRFLWPMQLRCSVQTPQATVAACVWVIAGSHLTVSATGHIRPDVTVWRCLLPLPTSIAVEQFHAALEVQDPLSVRLPGASATLRQGVQDCLAAPGSRT